ncbi:MAG: sigma-54-dependent Fis family transcriptional regulator, partial [Lysobacterales bacterium]
MNEHPLNVLVVDDDRDFVNDFKLLLPSNMQFGVTYSAEDAMVFLATHDIDVVFLDIDLGSGADGMDLLSKIKEEWPYLVVVMITADQRVNSVVKAMQLGASDYVGKDPDLGKLKLSIDRAMSQARLQQRYDLLAKELRDRVGDLIGESDAIQSVREETVRLSQVSSNVLITGESGTGKELVARGIHRLSQHRNQPFLAVNCAALSKELIESELFGHEKGSFTGAHSRRIGKFELVGEGTLFLDEITEIPPELQAKLLRVLQEREFERVGGNNLIPFQGRLLTSSNRDITQAVKDGILREDLYYRVNVSHLHLPTLAERKDDIPILVNYFVDVKSRDMKKSVRGVSQKTLQLLSSYHWPGNV